MRKWNGKTQTKIIANSVLCTALLLLIFIAGLFWSYYVGVQKRNAIKGGVIVEAEVVGISRGVAKTRSTADLVYEYRDSNGVYYTGLGKSFSNENEARRHIGTKIDIYIDGKGHSIAVGQKPSDKESLIAEIILIIVFIVLIRFYIKLLYQDKRERLIREEERKKVHPGLEGGSFLKDLQNNKAKEEDYRYYIQKDDITTDAAIEDASKTEKE